MQLSSKEDEVVAFTLRQGDAVGNLHEVQITQGETVSILCADRGAVFLPQYFLFAFLFLAFSHRNG